MSNLVKSDLYEDWTPEAAQEELKESEAADNEFIKLTVGRNVVRIMPPRKGMKSPFVVVYQHYINIPGETRAVVFACPRMNCKPARACPACQRADELMSTGNPADKDLGFKISAKRRVFCNAVSRANPEAGPKVLAFGKQIHEQLLALMEDPDAGGNYTHPVTGFDIVIKRTGTGQNDTEYKVLPGKAGPLGNEDWLTMMRDLAKYSVVPTPEQLAKMLKVDISALGGAPGVSTPRVGRAAPRTARTVESDADMSGDGN